MEVTPEVYAWLAQHKILNAEKTLIMRKDNLVLVDDSTFNKLLNGFFFDKIIYELENLYNKFYKIKLVYTQKLDEIKPLQQKMKNTNLDKTQRNYIWKIIGQVIENFGIEVSDAKINAISNGDAENLKSLLKTIFTLTNELKKRANSDKNPDDADRIDKEGSINARISPDKNLIDNSRSKFSNPRSPNSNYQETISNKNSTLLKNRRNNKSVSLNNSNYITESNDTVKISNDITSNKNNSINLKSFISNSITNQSIVKAPFHLKKSSDSLDLNNLNPNKNLQESESPLEFFILTLSRSLDMKPRQTIALLSNNRKYLIQIANRGIKGDYSKITNWYQEVIYNYSVLLNIIKFSTMKDLKAMTYATLSVGLFSKNLQVAQNAYGVLIQLEADIGPDYDWVIKEGLESFIFCINKHKELRTGLLNLLYKLGGKDIEGLNKEFFNTKKFTNLKIYEFISNIIEIIKLLGFQAFNFFKAAIPDFCFKENTEIATSICILADSWIILEFNSEVDSAIINNIIKFYKNAMREKGSKYIQFLVINQFFRLLSKLMPNKDSNASVIYKTLVFHFLENYDERNLREIFLNNFIHMFDRDVNFAIEILLDPYLRQIKNSNNFEIIDFNFLIKIIDYPKITIGILNEILEFGFYVSLTNMFYSRSANKLINEILEKNLINVKGSNSSKIFEDIINYIKNALKIFLQNPKDYMILEISYDILNFNFDNINKELEQDIIDTVENYRKEKGNYSMGLLALLWFYDSHDNVLLNIEEKYSEKFDKYYLDMAKKKNRELLERQKTIKAMPKNLKPIDVIKMIKERRDRENKIKEEIKNQKILQEKKLIKNLSKKVLDKSADAAKSILDTKLNNDTQIYTQLNNLTAMENNVSGFNSNVSLLNNITVLNPNSESINNNSSIIPKSGSAGDLSKIFNSILYKKNPLSYMKTFPYYIILEECEDREIIAIEGLFREFKPVIKNIFHNFSTDGNNTISRANFLKMTREIGIENDILSLDELGSIIRLTFGIPVNNLDKKQLDKLMVQVAYTIFGKIKSLMPVSQCLQEFFFYIDKSLKRVKNDISIDTFTTGLQRNPRNNKESISLKDNFSSKNSNKNSNKILNFLKNNIENILVSEEDMNYYFSPKDLEAVTNTDIFKTDVESTQSYNINQNKKNHLYEETESTFGFNRPLLIPPGFEKKLTTKVEYHYTLNKDFTLGFIPEAQIICYELIDEIIKNRFKRSVIEPSVRVFNYFKVSEVPIDPKKKWSDVISITYTKMDKQNEIIGKDVGDLLEDILKGIDRNWGGLEKPKILGPKDKEKLELQVRTAKENEEKDKNRLERKKEIKDQLAKMEENKQSEQKRKEEENKKAKENKEKQIQLQIQKEIEAKQKLKNDVQKAREEKDKIKEEKIKLEKRKAEEAFKKKEQEKLEFFKKQKRKLKEQFKEIKSVKNNFIRQQQELLNVKLPEVNIKKILDKDKEFVEFEKNLNENISQLLNRSDIKEVLADYENHLKTIYDIYSKIGSNKITFFFEDAIHFNEFKEFCINFMILGLLINTDQMNYIFRKVSKRNNEKLDDIFFLKFPDFLISLIYICLYLKITNRPKEEILPSDLDKIDASSIKALMDFIGLKVPFSKVELEALINDRRALSAKQMLKLHTQFKRERNDIVKPSSANRVRSSLLRNRQSIGKPEKNVDIKMNKSYEKDHELINKSSGNLNVIKQPSDNNDDRWQVVKKK